GETVAGDDGDLDAVGKGPSYTGIEDMGIALAADLCRLLQVAGGGEGGVGEGHRRGGHFDRVRHFDLPAGLSGRSAADDDIAAGFDERAADAELFEHLLGTVVCIS